MLANAVLACLFSLKSHPFCPLECGFPKRRLGGVFSFPKPQCHHCWWLLLLCKVTSLSPLSLCARHCCAQPGLAPGLEPALSFLAAIWHVLSIFVLTPFPFLEHFSRLGNSMGGCPQWLGCQQGGLPAPSWQAGNWTLPLPSPPGARAPSSAWALLQRRRERGASLPPHFPWGTQPGLLFAP